MELIHSDQADIGMLAFAQRLIGQNLGGAADDRRVGVDMAVAGDHAYVLTSEHFDQIEEFLADQRLDRSRIVRTATGAQGREMHAQRHQGFARPCRRVQNNMVPGENIHNGFFLMGPWLDAFDIDGPVEEPLVDIVRRQVASPFSARPIRGKPPQGTIGCLITHLIAHLITASSYDHASLPVFKERHSYASWSSPPLRNSLIAFWKSSRFSKFWYTLANRI